MGETQLITLIISNYQCFADLFHLFPQHLLLLLPQLLQSCLTLSNPMDRGPPGSSGHGISQARTLEWVSSLPGQLPDPGIEPKTLMSPALAGGFFTTSVTVHFCFLGDLKANHRHHAISPVNSHFT